MHLNLEDKARLGGGVTVVKEPPGPDRPAQRDPEVSATDDKRSLAPAGTGGSADPEPATSAWPRLPRLDSLNSMRLPRLLIAIKC